MMSASAEDASSSDREAVERHAFAACSLRSSREVSASSNGEEFLPPLPLPPPCPPLRIQPEPLPKIDKAVPALLVPPPSSPFPISPNKPTAILPIIPYPPWAFCLRHRESNGLPCASVRRSSHHAVRFEGHVHAARHDAHGRAENASEHCRLHNTESTRHVTRWQHVAGPRPTSGKASVWICPYSSPQPPATCLRHPPNAVPPTYRGSTPFPPHPNTLPENSAAMRAGEQSDESFAVAFLLQLF